MTIPRFADAVTNYLPSRKNESRIFSEDLIAKRKLHEAKKAKELVNWSKIVKVLQDHFSISMKDISTFMSTVKKLFGFECSTDLLEEGCAFVFKVFLSLDCSDVSETAIKTMETFFKPVSRSELVQAMQSVFRIFSFTENDRKLLEAELNQISCPSNKVEFGAGINLSFSMESDWNGNCPWLRAFETTKNYDFNINESLSLRKNKDCAKYDFSVLLNACLLNMSHTGLDYNTLKSSLCSIIRDVRNNEELEQKLVDFLGLENIDFISIILSEKGNFLTFLQSGDVSSSQAFEKFHTEKEVKTKYGCGVVIQTEEEKQLFKSVRKEEKKLGRKRDDDNNDETFNGSNFNANDLRIKREIALVTSLAQPLFVSDKRSTEVVSYPHVYDSYSKAKSSTAFVGNSKMVLPAGFERVDNESFEQIDIPCHNQPPAEIKKKFVYIEEMDEMGQMAFNGVKKLNLIQSIVYPAAYSSNENLLICAPTGAGKTNIAMLAVLKELRANLSNGVIKKDEFKIIYIAPMKALAAEMVQNFGKRLQPLGITVMELTGDMQLTKAEISRTQMIVTTPEKWDVVTRKSTGDVALSQMVRLLIIDEVHLLHDDRGSVIESIVARTLRQVESSQTMIRIVGLSATLPNYIDVAKFLRVNPNTGLFFFDSRFRPVPLTQTFIGVKTGNRLKQLVEFNNICYQKVYEQVKKGYQVMVFVHARNETVRTAQALICLCENQNHREHFVSNKFSASSVKGLQKSNNYQLKEMFPKGFAIHHAGMLRQDRNFVEKSFADGLVKVIVCTATLAWGVNLPAHAVVIKGTQIYDAKKGSFVDLGILDVMQIFGRAGRPQYDTFGHGMIITTHDKLAHYLSLLIQANPIESQFINGLEDHLNAEISLGTVTNVEEAVRWLSYTYLFVRMKLNPLVYGITYSKLREDPSLEAHRKDLIVISSRKLDKAHMIRFDEPSGSLNSTSLGRTASHYYIKYDTIEVFNEIFCQIMTEDKILEMISKAQEFDQIKVREEEMIELDEHLSRSCLVNVAGGIENPHGKVNVLLQTFISKEPLDSFSLISDQAYVVQNAGRIARALFEIALHKSWPTAAGKLLLISKVIEKRLWMWQNPIRQFVIIPGDVLSKLEQHGLSVDRLKEMDEKEIGNMIHNSRYGPIVKRCALQIPSLNVEWSIQPITRTVLKVSLTCHASFIWNDKVHGKIAESFWIWIEDPENDHIYHHEFVLMHKKNVVLKQPQVLVFTIPIFEPLPSQYYVRVVSDKWLGSQDVFPISFKHLILPERHPPHTELLDLQPLPRSALNDPKLESLYKFSHFNPIQTQIFHTLYHQDGNVLIGAPTGSGKTVAAELAIFRVFREYPNAKAVYIAPLKALVRERMEDWKVRLEEKLGKHVVELTGDVLPDMGAVSRADLIVTTPEKWDGISRSWQSRNYVKAVAVLIIDEIHLLGDDRGPVLEVIVSRTNFISSHTTKKVRVVGLSTALANARDLAEWLGIKESGLFNFRPSVRPVPLEVHISGFPGRHYCPRMATMNKPTFQAIQCHSPQKPVLIFVSSRRQTRLTALDLIAFLAVEDSPKQWLHIPESEIEMIIRSVKESNLRLTLAFGIGLHHAGLHENDRKIVEELFVNQKIQVLIATSTLAWGVNFPAHLVVVKGTEYYDGKTKRYVDFPITDVLQMMGRAGRPQFDDQGKAVILVHDVKKHFYKKFLYEPFPVESSLLNVLADHLNAEVVAGTICSKQDAIDYLTWTYFFRRLLINPSYYGLDDLSHEKINKFLSSLVQKSILNLSLSGCLVEEDDGFNLVALAGGKIASYYYLNHLTICHFNENLRSECSIEELLKILSEVHEFSLLPVRHNEDRVNEELSQKLPIKLDSFSFDNPNTKAHLLFQAHFTGCQLPSSDYQTDTKSVMDQAMRVMQAMLDMSAEKNWLITTIGIVHLMQMIIQGLWIQQNSLLTLPHIKERHLEIFKKAGSSGESINSLPQIINFIDGKYPVLERMLNNSLTSDQINQVFEALIHLPIIKTRITMQEVQEQDIYKNNEKKVVFTSNQDGQWLNVSTNKDYMLNVELTRTSRLKTSRKSNYVYPTKFPKPKEEGWVLLLGEVETREVVALKKIGFVRSKTAVQLLFKAPSKIGKRVYTLFLMSDSYLGLDQQYEILLDVKMA